MTLVDTHCHIQEADYPLDREQTLQAAIEAGVTKVLVVGTDMKSSVDAVKFARERENVWAIVGVHPHETKHGIDGLAELATEPKVVGIGEIGLDYYYNHSPREMQIEILNQQLEIALKRNLPISFHVREAFDDFWPIFDNFHGIRGVLHSFTDSISNMGKGLERGLLIGVNGIATFNKDLEQAKMYKSIPLERMILETDAPFLAPKPYRGKTNQPAFVRNIAEFLASDRGDDLNEIAISTTKNAETTFQI